MKLACFLFALQLAASPIQTGPISLTGSGALTDPDYGSGGEGLGGLGLSFHASGTNGPNTVLIDVPDIEIWGPDFFQDVYLQGQLVFDDLGGCTFWMSIPARPLCGITIDGTTGFGAFSSLGRGIGLVQVFDAPYGTLLASASIVNTAIEVTSVTYGGGSAWCPECPNQTGSFVAQFAIADPPAGVPELSTLVLGLVGLAALGWRIQTLSRAGGK